MMRKHYQEMKTYILENLSPDGVFTKKYGEIAQDLSMNINVVRNIIIDIVNDGILEILNPPTRGKNSNPLYRLKSNELTMKEISPITSDDTKVINFEGVEILLRRSDIGYCISEEDLALSTIESSDLISKIVQANPESFEGNVTIIDDVRYYNRTGVLNYLLKLNLTRVLDSKRKVLHSFQQNVVTVLSNAMLYGKIVINEKNRVEIKNNLRYLTDIHHEDLELLFHDLEGQINGLFAECVTKNIKCKHDIERLNKDNTKLQNKLELESKSKEILLTENRQLKNKLMERN